MSNHQPTSPTRKLLHLAMALLPAIGWWVSYGWVLVLTGLFVVLALASLNLAYPYIMHICA